MSDILQALLDSGALYLALGAILCIKRDLRSSYLLAYCTRLGSHEGSVRTLSHRLPGGWQQWQRTRQVPRKR